MVLAKQFQFLLLPRNVFKNIFIGLFQIDLFQKTVCHPVIAPFFFRGIKLSNDVKLSSVA